MVEDKGAWAIVQDSKHGISIYHCALPVAKSLVQSCLAREAHAVRALKQAIDGGRTAREASWLAKALHDVLAESADPRHLSRVIFGMASRGVLAGEAQVAPGWRDELLTFLFDRNTTINKQSLMKTVTSLSCEDLLACWQALSFLAPARQRLGDDLLLVSDDVFEGYDLLQDIEKDRWKPEAKEHRVIERYHCAFLSQWGVGSWSVAPIHHTP